MTAPSSIIKNSIPSWPNLFELNRTRESESWKNICQKTYETANRVFKDDLARYHTNRPICLGLAILAGLATSGCIMIHDNQQPLKKDLTAGLGTAFFALSLNFLFVKLYGDYESKEIKRYLDKLKDMKNHFSDQNQKNDFFNYITSKKSPADTSSENNPLTCYELVDYYTEYTRIEKFT